MEQGKKRYHVDYDFMCAPLTAGALNIYQICDLACSYDYEVKPHRQICHEISYVAEGQGVFERNGAVYPMMPGQLFLVKNGDMHNIYSSKTAPLRYLCIGFTFNRRHEDFKKYEQPAAFFDRLPATVAPDLYNMYELLSAAIGEISAPQALSEEMLEALVRQIIIGTYRSFQGKKRSRYTEGLPRTTINPLIYEMIRYMDENLSSPGKLGQMEQALGYSYSYLSRLFSATMGSTLRQYYNRRRFEKAAELLKEPLSLAHIAEKLGYADTPTFCKAFKRYCKVSPGEYRRTQTK